jgi:hypothetical protein
MQKINKIGVMSLGKILGFLYALLGLIFGGLFSLGIIVGSLFSRAEGAGGSITWAIALLFLVPAFYGALGFVFGLLTAWLYNLAAKYIGGLEIEMEVKSETPQQ